MNSKDVKNSGISHWRNRARMHRCDFDQTSELQSQSRTVSTENPEKNVQNLFLFNNVKDGTLLPQVIPGGIGTRPKAGEAHEFNSFFQIVCCSWFRLQLMAICCNRRGVWTVHFIRHFFSCSEHAPIVVHHTAWLKNVLLRVMSSTWSSTSVVCSLTLCSSPCSFPCFSPILSYSTWTLSWTSSSMWPSSGQYPTGTQPTEKSAHLAEITPLTVLDRFTTDPGPHHSSNRIAFWILAHEWTTLCYWAVVSTRPSWVTDVTWRPPKPRNWKTHETRRAKKKKRNRMPPRKTQIVQKNNQTTCSCSGAWRQRKIVLLSCTLWLQKIASSPSAPSPAKSCRGPQNLPSCRWVLWNALEPRDNAKIDFAYNGPRLCLLLLLRCRSLLSFLCGATAASCFLCTCSLTFYLVILVIAGTCCGEIPHGHCCPSLQFHSTRVLLVCGPLSLLLLSVVGALRREVLLTVSLYHHELLLWDLTFSTSSGGWVSYSAAERTMAACSGSVFVAAALVSRQSPLIRLQCAYFEHRLGPCPAGTLCDGFPLEDGSHVFPFIAGNLFRIQRFNGLAHPIFFHNHRRIHPEKIARMSANITWPWWVWRTVVVRRNQQQLHAGSRPGGGAEDARQEAEGDDKQTDTGKHGLLTNTSPGTSWDFHPFLTPSPMDAQRRRLDHKTLIRIYGRPFS